MAQDGKRVLVVDMDAQGNCTYTLTGARVTDSTFDRAGVYDMFRAYGISGTQNYISRTQFDNIDIISFKYLYNKYIKNSYYGKYSKLNNLEVIINSLEHKQKLQPKMQELLEKITTNMDTIKKDLLTNKLNNIDIIINSLT